MSIDLSEFHDVFFEECVEGLEVMESGLLSLDHGADTEEINAIFRAAHSIKGGSAAFGFTDISGFTHVMETLLDEMRDGRRAVSRDAVDLLLKSVDCLREMVNAARNQVESDKERAAAVQKELKELLALDGSAQSSSRADAQKMPAAPSDGNGLSGWRIRFRPHAEMLQTGNDPVRILRELEALGEYSVQVDLSGIPSYESLDPERCHLAWELTVKGGIDKAKIDELFEWVADDSELMITPLGEADATDSDAEPAGEPIAALPAAAATHDDARFASSPAADEAPSDPASGKDKSAEEPTCTPGAQRAAPKDGRHDSGSIRVGIGKVDELINLVGELVITQSMLNQVGAALDTVAFEKLETLRDGLTQLERNTRDLQKSVLQIRMLPISFCFSRFPRLVRDLGNKMGKKVELKLTGEQTEVDKTVLEKIGDPLVHLVRNSLDHGLEKPEVRKSAGKPETGVLELRAYHEGGDIIIKVIDDGAGLHKERILGKAMEKGLVSENEELSDERIHNLIFLPGFSTAEQISDVSGRGVGMDVVRRNIRDLGGNVSIQSNAGSGSTVTIRLPLTLAILDGQLITVGKETYVISLVSIVESIQIKPEHLSTITGQTELYKLRHEYIPIIRLNELFEMETGISNLQEGLLVIVEAEEQRVGLFVDDLQGQQQVVIKSLDTNFRQIQGVSGATILGNGTVALILDVPGLIRRYYKNCNKQKLLVSAVA